MTVSHCCLFSVPASGDAFFIKNETYLVIELLLLTLNLIIYFLKFKFISLFIVLSLYIYYLI